MFTVPVGPVEVFFYWPEAVLGNFYWPGAIGSPLASGPDIYIWELTYHDPTPHVYIPHIQRPLEDMSMRGSLGTSCRGKSMPRRNHTQRPERNKRHEITMEIDSKA